MYVTAVHLRHTVYSDTSSVECIDHNYVRSFVSTVSQLASWQRLHWYYGSDNIHKCSTMLLACSALLFISTVVPSGQCG